MLDEIFKGNVLAATSVADVKSTFDKLSPQAPICLQNIPNSEIKEAVNQPWALFCQQH
jgi:hypothetical protein